VRIVAELAADVLQVPREAVIDTGERQVVFVAAENGHFEPRKVKTGLESSEGTVQVLSGVAPGERVVVSGQFLLDSESRMKEAIQKHLARNLLKPTAHTAATQATRPVLRGEWTKQVDAVVVAYLELAELFGQKEAALKPVDAGKLEAAAKALAAGASEAEIKSLAERVGQAAGALGGKGTEEQRKLFKALSDAVIAMVDRSPPTKAAVGRLFVVHCSMAPGTWLQRTNEVANPYYATAMKGCGEVQREISLVESK
jgi:Cu(I)/Ag(I) efflux system membrane fusion protein